MHTKSNILSQTKEQIKGEISPLTNGVLNTTVEQLNELVPEDIQETLNNNNLKIDKILCRLRELIEKEKRKVSYKFDPLIDCGDYFCYRYKYSYEDLLNIILDEDTNKSQNIFEGKILTIPQIGNCINELKNLLSPSLFDKTLNRLKSEEFKFLIYDLTENAKKQEYGNVVIDSDKFQQIEQTEKLIDLCNNGVKSLKLAFHDFIDMKILSDFIVFAGKNGIKSIDFNGEDMELSILPSEGLIKLVELAGKNGIIALNFKDIFRYPKIELEKLIEVAGKNSIKLLDFSLSDFDDESDASYDALINGIGKDWPKVVDGLSKKYGILVLPLPQYFEPMD